MSKVLIKKYSKLIDKNLPLVYSKGPKSLVDTFQYVINSPGKRIRPILTLITSRIFKADLKIILPASL